MYCGYDTETTTQYDCIKDKYYSAVYIFQISIFNMKDDNRVYLMRTWGEFQRSIEYLNKYYNLNENRLLLIGVANLGFEFSFMCHRLHWNEDDYSFFAKEVRKPLLCTCGGVQFREILSISGGSLAYTADKYCKTKKLVGDLDYTIPRNSHTELTAKEEAYCINDVVIVSEYMHFLMQKYLSGFKKKMPLTKTAVLNDEIKTHFRKQCRNKDKAAHVQKGTHEGLYMQYLKEIHPSQDTYKTYFEYLFRGGYVHANALYTDIDLKPEDNKGVLQRDITSSYPEWMLCGYCPEGHFKPATFSKEALKSKCCIMHALFYKISAKTTHSIESRSKIVSYAGADFDNGRLVRADYIEVWLTELDFDNYRHFYQWEGEPVILDFLTSDRRPLPSFFTDIIKGHYKEKAKLKMSGLQDTIDYVLHKEGVNSGYGLSVKRMREDKIKYNDDWYIDKSDFDFNKEVANTVLSPYMGFWISAGARHNLLTMVWRLESAGVHVVYCDTDSIKYIKHPKAERIFYRYNLRTGKLLKRRGLRAPEYAGLGYFDKECKGKVTRFKTLGAKRYIYAYDDKIVATIAGLPKISIKALGKDVNEIFDNFTKYGFSLDTDDSGKLTAQYTDKPYDLLVDGEWLSELSGCALRPIPFKLTIKSEYAQYIAEIQEAMRDVV